MLIKSCLTAPSTDHQAYAEPAARRDSRRQPHATDLPPPTKRGHSCPPVPPSGPLCPDSGPEIILLVHSEIVLDSGLRITINGRPPQGSKHEVLFGVLRDTGEPVVVKLERISGALAREGAALKYLTARGGPSPELKAAGVTDVSGERVVCLVVKRQEGAAPTSREGWRRMGRALGRLAEPVSDVEQLPVLDRERFGDEHVQRVRELGDRLAVIATGVPDWPSLASPEVPGRARSSSPTGIRDPAIFSTTVVTGG